ncbi:MAG: fused N-dimethylarginine dimethylaminohydrolase/saccharopine dehydrogenase domain-containing protein, partial [Pseudomonadota bacterium]
MANARDRILMCPPDHFTVDYVINPWMAGQEDELDKDKAVRQWNTLKDEIAEYADVVTMEPQPDLPDLVFTANAGVVYRDKAIASHFMPQERRPEEPHYKNWFRQNGFELLDLDEKIGFEGAGDCLFDRRGDWLWTGYGFRTEIEA